MKKRIKIPIYNFDWDVVVTSDIIAGAAKYDIEDVENTDALAFCKDGVAVILFSEKGLTPGIIAHEAKHLVNMLFDEIGHTLDLTNDEPECYLLGWIVTEIHKVMQAYNIDKLENER